MPLARSRSSPRSRCHRLERRRNQALEERGDRGVRGHVQLEHDLCSQLLGYRNHGYDAENPETAQLLFRMTSDDRADMEWGDAECLDSYVPNKDLAKGVFKKAYPYVGD